MPRVLIHVGFAKTATTMLQEQLFGRHGQIANVGKPYDHAPSDLVAAIRYVGSADTIAYDGSGPEVGRLRSAIDAGISSGRTVVLSDESLCHPRRNDPGAVARRLFEIRPEAHILFTIREQRALLVSHYLHDVRHAVNEGHSHGFASWMNRERWLFRWIDYHRTIAFYATLFGRERVHVLPFEELAENRDRYGDRLAAALDLPAAGVRELLTAAPTIKRRVSRAQLAIQRFSSLFVPAAARIGLRPVHRALFRMLAVDRAAARVRIPTRLGRKLQATLAEGNRRLAFEFDLPLARLGYMTAPPEDAAPAVPMPRDRRAPAIEG